ncbi:hypothetical protein JQ634_19125 [Bradyrhizobium sp. AUGA SZCCT0240]|uniref:hypothetical protein n=1 Tax=unclassified Bradyrhizobium TaxID=2631580 RepID=UPI001BAB81CF|nr:MULTISPECIES: hypothetical protein [unclassified Bradyrhizobium]MBR1201064.1 hypothetical protein [Bradyrhizobium sp. AUGA SZCCT0158]MBR1241135.1 hypothetical protein [Bradyrhizobium sp. AUGA SZCCT0274]MBR1255808.1 hypothetical protein [Bradyrhizobium sp. AUGA SZCCT0240]
MASDLRIRDLNAEADEALEAARTMPNGQAKMEALKKSRTAAQRCRCWRDFIRKAWQATKVRPPQFGGPLSRR